MSRPNGVNIELVRAMYAAKFQEQADRIVQLETRIASLQRELDSANDQIAQYKDVVFKTQMKLDAAEERAAE